MYVHTCFLCVLLPWSAVCCTHTSPRPMMTCVRHNVWMCVCMHTHIHTFIYPCSPLSLLQSGTGHNHVEHTRACTHARTHTHTTASIFASYTHTFCYVITVQLFTIFATLWHQLVLTAVSQEFKFCGLISVCMHTSVKRHTLCFLFLVSMGNHEANTARTTLTPSRVKRVATKCVWWCMAHSRQWLASMTLTMQWPPSYIYQSITHY